MSFEREKPNKLGLYLHIPFCSSLCHYCDFNKTARGQEDDFFKYCQSLEKHFDCWYESPFLNNQLFTSLNFGGGTPSLLSYHYENLFRKLQACLTAECEISLEANPNDLSQEKLKIWKDLGFNRISIGVQSFQDKGLNFLKRDHTVKGANLGIDLAKKYFKKINIDLIYNWPSQSLDDWKFELDKALSLEPSSLSLYNLTYAEKTPIGRMKKRGLIREVSDDEQALFYEYASELLRDNGFIQDEVSNWSKPGNDCNHNQLYWQNGFYLGLGVSACGYLPEKDNPIGFRYQYTNSLKKFLSQDFFSIYSPLEQVKDLKNIDVEVDTRNNQAWLFEVLVCGLRSKKGICLNLVERIGGFIFKPCSKVKLALEKGSLKIEDNRIILDHKEWFRETSWCVLLSESFLLQEKRE